MSATRWTRREFLAASAALMATLAIAGCGDDEPSASDFDGNVIIIGAGPAGMTAAHQLRQRGIDVTVLEAGPTHGGRIRHDLEFTDFPISLGAEWMHVERDILGDIVNDPDVKIETAMVGYTPLDEVLYFDGVATVAPLEPDVFDGDLKFSGSSWLDFFDTYVMPQIEDSIVLDTQIVEVDHSGTQVQLTDSDGNGYVADRVIVTVPLKILQRRDISFVPALEPDRSDAIDRAVVWSGLKAFFEFDEKFYPAAVAFADAATPQGQRLFYDAAYRQATNQHILGLFSVGAQAERYQALSPSELVDDVLDELDEAFDGAASRSYVRHLVQNWNDEPFAGAAYLEDDAPSDISTRLAEPLGDLVYFAGDAYTSFDDWSAVHTAAMSAIDTVRQLLGSA